MEKDTFIAVNECQGRLATGGRGETRVEREMVGCAI